MQTYFKDLKSKRFMILSEDPVAKYLQSFDNRRQRIESKIIGGKKIRLTFFTFNLS